MTKNLLEGITWHAQGEANFYRLMRDGNWLAVIQINGELLVCQQEEILRSMLSTPSGTPAMPVKAYYHEWTDLEGVRTRSVGLEVRKEFADAPLVLESDALARIACLEGEIAKRDARIDELESRYQRDVYGLNNEGDPIGGDPAGGYANDNARLRAELSALKAQEPVAHDTKGSRKALGAMNAKLKAKIGMLERELAAAPAAPAADAGLVYDKELHEAWTDRLIDLTKSYREAADGGEVRDAFRAIKAHIEVQPMSMAMLTDEARVGVALQRKEIDRLKHQLRAELSALKAQDTVGEVVGWYRLDRPYEMTPYPSVCATWHRLGAPVAPLYAAHAQQENN